MASAPMDHHAIDLEAHWQRYHDVLSHAHPVPYWLEEPGRARIRGWAPSETESDDSTGTLPVSVDLEVEPDVQLAEGSDEYHIYDTDAHLSGRDDTSTRAPAQAGQGNGQDATVIKDVVNPALEKQSIGSISAPHDGIPEQESQDKRMMGDFDSSANTLWTLFRNEAKSYDEARIQTLKDDMDGVLIFAGLFSAALTAFIIDSKNKLKVDPADQMVYYLQQNVAILAQISHQISSIAPQIVIPSSPPPPYPAFITSSSDVRVNVFWFMALVFSLSAALLAILVQQWVRDYMHVFQRYSDPLKSARLRQYLHEGSEKWYMPVVAEAVPGLLHVSLFLFFVGLGDFVLNINATVGLSTIVPIGICGLLYIIAIFAPVIYPQSPYQNSFSGLVWYLLQRSHGRRYKDRSSDGMSKSVSANMSQGQLQLAMEETEKRMRRDEEAIRWLVDNLTEETEMELFVAAIPGSFNAEWGIEVWKRVSEIIQDENKITTGSELALVPLTQTDATTPGSPRTSVIKNSSGYHSRNSPHPSFTTSSRGETVTHELSRRIAHLLETCKTRGLFASQEQWRKRTRGCVESAALLVFHANAELGWFGNFLGVLGDIGSIDKLAESLSTGMDSSFVTRWTCLSIMAIRPLLSSGDAAKKAVDEIRLCLRHDGDGNGKGDEQTLWNAQKVDRAFDDQMDRLLGIHAAFFDERTLADVQRLAEWEIIQTLRSHETGIIELEQALIELETSKLKWVDGCSRHVLNEMDRVTHGITRQLPGLHDRYHTEPTEPFPFSQLLDLFEDPHKYLLIPPAQAVRDLCSFGPKLRKILDGQDIKATLETLEMLNDIGVAMNRNMVTNILERHLWRLQDLRDGGGLGFTVELFFLALKQLLSSPLSQDSQSALYIGTFRAITSDWSLYKHSIGTQKILLDAVASKNGILCKFSFPDYITDEFLVLLENMLDEQTGPHIDNAVQELRRNLAGTKEDKASPEFKARALAIISQSQIAAIPASSSS